MENYNNMMNNEYNAMVYGGNMQPQQQQQPMTSIPAGMQVPQTQQPIHQQLPTQSDIINLSYHQRPELHSEIMPHPNLPQQMGLFPTISIPPQIQQQHNHIMQQQQHPVIEPVQQIPQNVNIQYNIDNVNVSLDVQNNNDNFEAAIVEKDSSIDEGAAVIDPDAHMAVPIGEEAIASIEDDPNKELESKPEEPAKKKEPEVDPNQCRVCKSAEQLIDIFAIEEDMRICDIIMKICSNVRIHERDFLPHMICLGCLGRLRTAYQFVKEVQVTDKELRGKLKRSKSKVRKPSDGFVLIDCNEFSESDDDDGNDDEEYKISEVEEEDESSESGTGSEDSRKIRPPKKRGGRKSKSKKIKQEMVATTKRLKRDIVFIEADNSSDEKSKKKERCKECGKVFSNKNSLKLHRKSAHFRAEDAPFKCHICGRGFKYSINLTSHMQIHKESYSCDECGRVFASKSDVKKHALNQHKCSLSYECNKCRRLYCSVKRYQKHRESCSDYGTSSSKKKPSSSSSSAAAKVKEDFSFTGRDLFKTVAPVTTTHWSDSFSD